jgi:hypothetical protein
MSHLVFGDLDAAAAACHCRYSTIEKLRKRSVTEISMTLPSCP